MALGTSWSPAARPRTAPGTFKKGKNIAKFGEVRHILHNSRGFLLHNSQNALEGAAGDTPPQVASLAVLQAGHHRRAVGGRHPLLLPVLEVSRPRRLVVGGVLGEGELGVGEGGAHDLDLVGEVGRFRHTASGNGGIGTPPLLSLHPVGPARMSRDAGMFAWNRSQDSCSRSKRRPKPLAAASSPGNRSTIGRGRARRRRSGEGGLGSDARER
ncbi:hypothetical protein ACQJBY_007497 [Aegilops geniculata]